LDGRPKNKRPVGRSNFRWEDDIKMDFEEIGIDEANCIQVAPDRINGGICEHNDEPSGSMRK
jgi:hypothetical protein